jgi:hypothetical protein
MCLICDVSVTASKRSNAGYFMTMYKGFINQETDNKVIKTSVF